MKNYQLNHLRELEFDPIFVIREIRCVIKEIRYKVNLNNLEQILDDKTVQLNDMARVTIRTTKPLFTDPYRTNRITGALILIDEGANEKVGVGMLE